MKLRIAVLCFVVFSFCLASVALVATPSAPVASLTVLTRGYYTFAIGSATGGVQPYSYFWSIDGGAFVEGASITDELVCGPLGNSSLDFKVIDDNGQESNVESFVCLF